MEDGSFRLPITPLFINDTLTFSSIGYTPQRFAIQQALISDFVVVLKPQVILMQDLLFTGSSKQLIKLGHPPKSKFTKAGFFFNRLGHEIGTLFTTNQEVLYLDSVQLNFVTCEYDSVFIRLNVYNMNSVTLVNVLPKNILLKYSKEEILNRPIIDLTPLELLVGSRFMVSVEIIKDLGGSGLKFFATLKASEDLTWYRITSQGDWKVATHKGNPIGISMQAFMH